ncbi:MAG: FkbM family methyltransferase [Salinirussus sp.]|jgi:FkbM family methyltransferase
MATGEERRHPSHERLRDVLPAVECGTCAGVRVPQPAEPRKPFDRLFARGTPEHSPFEGGLASVHREHTHSGEDVTVVGGGFGITTVAAAETGARVTVYEASADRLAALRETLRLNGVDPSRVTPRQAVVGTLADAEVEAKGLDPDAAPAVPATDLLPCDVLELDCEGAELAVLRGLRAAAPDTSLPRLVAAEVHPIKLGEDPQVVLELLSGLGYEPTAWLTHDGAAVSRGQFEGLLAGETPDVTGPDHQEFPPVVVAER